MEAQRDVADVRALLIAHGPATLFQEIETACAELSASGVEPARSAEMETAALLARQAASLLRGEPSVPSPEPSPDDEAAHDPVDQSDAAHDPVDQSDEEEDDEDERGGEEDDAEDEDQDDDAGAEDQDEQESESPREDATTMVKEDALGQRPSMAATWCLRFRAKASDKWMVMSRRENDRLDTSEWQMRSCTMDRILRDWPDLTGEIRVQYMKRAIPGDKSPRVCGYSNIITVRAAARQAADANEEAKGVRAAPVEQPAPSSSTSIQDLLHLETMRKLSRDEEREERRRDREDEREERRRALDDQIEIRRIQHQEAMDRLELQARVNAARPAIELEPFTTRMNELTNQVVAVSSHLQEMQEALAERESASPPAPPQPQPLDLNAIVNAFKELAPLVALAMKSANDNTGPSVASAPLPPPYQPPRAHGTGTGGPQP